MHGLLCIDSLSVNGPHSLSSASLRVPVKKHLVMSFRDVLYELAEPCLCCPFMWSFFNKGKLCMVCYRPFREQISQKYVMSAQDVWGRRVQKSNL